MFVWSNTKRAFKNKLEKGLKNLFEEVFEFEEITKIWPFNLKFSPMFVHYRITRIWSNLVISTYRQFMEHTIPELYLIEFRDSLTKQKE